MKLRHVIAITACAAAVGLSACGDKCPTETPQVDAVANCTARPGSTVTVPLRLCPTCNQTAASCDVDTSQAASSGIIQLDPVVEACESASSLRAGLRPERDQLHLRRAVPARPVRPDRLQPSDQLDDHEAARRGRERRDELRVLTDWTKALLRARRDRAVGGSAASPRGGPPERRRRPFLGGEAHETGAEAGTQRRAPRRPHVPFVPSVGARSAPESRDAGARSETPAAGPGLCAELRVPDAAPHLSQPLHARPRSAGAWRRAGASCRPRRGTGSR